MSVHLNSIISHSMLELSVREAQVLAALDRLGGRATDRQIAREMGSEDPNRARPRVTRLIQGQILREVGSVFDASTRRAVRQVERVK
jgi:hypothetical protein